MWGWGLTGLVYLTPKKKKRLLSFQEADFEEDSDHSMQTCSQNLGLSSVPASVHSMQVGALWCLLLPPPPSQEPELRGKCLDPSWSCPWGCSVIEPGGHIRLPRQGDFGGDRPWEHRIQKLNILPRPAPQGTEQNTWRGWGRWECKAGQVSSEPGMWSLMLSLEIRTQEGRMDNSIHQAASQDPALSYACDLPGPHALHQQG